MSFDTEQPAHRLGRSAGVDRGELSVQRSVGAILKFWRGQRGMSQLFLAGESGVSAKHISFVETGRSRPSRQLLVHLSDTLALPLRERNRLLLAGGFAPAHGERTYDDRAMMPLRTALNDLLAAHEPNPALVVNAHWELVGANSAAELLFDGVAHHLMKQPINMLRLSIHPEGLPRISTATALCSRPIARQLRRRALDNADDTLLALVSEVERYLAADEDAHSLPGWAGDGVMATFELTTRLGSIRLFTVIATLGAPLDVTAADLAIETFLPADQASAVTLRRLAETRGAKPPFLPVVGQTDAM